MRFASITSSHFFRFLVLNYLMKLRLTTRAFGIPRKRGFFLWSRNLIPNNNVLCDKVLIKKAYNHDQFGHFNFTVKWIYSVPTQIMQNGFGHVPYIFFPSFIFIFFSSFHSISIFNCFSKGLLIEWHSCGHSQFTSHQFLKWIFQLNCVCRIFFQIRILYRIFFTKMLQMNLCFKKFSSHSFTHVKMTATSRLNWNTDVLQSRVCITNRVVVL